ncbi:hypothetical protein IVA80_15225 [Bradyrhizobium sp. 139]|uniref:hypothetical protein n=1 Tax=Bradyrhizobium sp. 139 TaxID=2782616 RepID=UPI001FF76710|nr:hypothetical protein [Bradyrhizobium sp. 139]MCK1742175.1 hypothetical protein [Bradyrhizobium sp. 139]
MKISTTSADDRFTRIFFGVSTSLIAAGVLGVWSMSTTLSRLDERVAILGKTFSDRIDTASKQIEQIAQQQRESDRRLGFLEGKTR